MVLLLSRGRGSLSTWTAVDGHGLSCKSNYLPSYIQGPGEVPCRSLSVDPGLTVGKYGWYYVWLSCAWLVVPAAWAPEYRHRNILPGAPTSHCVAFACNLAVSRILPRPGLRACQDMATTSSGPAREVDSTSPTAPGGPLDSFCFFPPSYFLPFLFLWFLSMCAATDLAGIQQRRQWCCTTRRDG